MNENLVMINGEILDGQEAKFPVADRAHQFGDGVFEIVTVHEGKAFMLEEHMERFFENMVKVKMPVVYMVEELVEFHKELIEASGMVEGEIYSQLSRGVGPYELDFPEQCIPELVMQVIPVDRAKQEALRQEGVNLMTVPDDRWGHCDINTLNRMPEVLARHTARVGHCYDALFVREEKITEAPEAAFMLVKDEILWTYPAKKNIRTNLVRDLIKKKLAPQLDLQVLEKAFTKEFALTAEEAFLCDARNGIMPVVKIDRRKIGEGAPGQTAKDLQAALEACMKECGK
mgnify:CR=1 FL=1